jgi:hypothetical protein
MVAIERPVISSTASRKSIPADSAVHSLTEARDSVNAPTRIRLRTSSQPMIGTTVGKKCVSGLSTNSSPASAVTPPPAMAKDRASRRSDPATSSIMPAATSSPPIMSEGIVLPAGSSAAAAPNRMIANPATRSARALPDRLR